MQQPHKGAIKSRINSTCTISRTPTHPFTPRLYRDTLPTTVLGGAFTLLAHNASAQLVYAPAGATAVPTMGAYALIALSILLAVMAFVKGKFSAQGVNSLFALCVVGALISGTSGMSLMNQAFADGNGGDSGSVKFIDSPTGGSVPITGDVLNIFENTSGVTQRIEALGLPSETCDDLDSGLIDGAPQCGVGDTVSSDSNGMCYVDCRVPSDGPV
ncbi:MAG: midcut-by-XrtH protein [Congregibacter sp.]